MKLPARNIFYRNSLSIIFILMFLLSWGAQIYFGWRLYTHELEERGKEAVSLSAYFWSGHSISATFENFQSEFFQMFLYVVLTIFLRQVGSAESKDPELPEEVDREPLPSASSPAPVKAGGWRLRIYKHSLSIVFALLFAGSWGGHLLGSYRNFNEEKLLNDEPAVPLSEFLAEPDFWFETFQNWQSEFLSIASIVILTIFLRQKGSPESKPVDAPHNQTGK
ncbi:hypothetical protein GCM10023091_04210 [Ravibacter arvi]|uniref:Uncharacterized protein n=1 Tax=Ravibacter arvi TaxID=2051041 RepID=A0ABP8LNM5_9BACT